MRKHSKRMAWLFLKSGKSIGELMNHEKILLALLSCCLLQFALQASAEELETSLTLHMAIIMPAEVVEVYDEPAEYEGVEFPLFCGIASLYGKENRFVFTKMTDLPILRVENTLRQFERDGYIVSYGGFLSPNDTQIQPKHMAFEFLFLQEIQIRGFEAYLISRAPEAPVDYTPQFMRTCRYSTAKTPPTDCAYTRADIESLYIPLTDEEVRATIYWE